MIKQFSLLWDEQAFHLYVSLGMRVPRGCVGFKQRSCNDVAWRSSWSSAHMQNSRRNSSKPSLANTMFLPPEDCYGQFLRWTMIVQQKRYWNLNIYLKLYFILYLIDLFTALAQLWRVGLASTNTGCFQVCHSLCVQWQACLRKMCHHSCNIHVQKVWHKSYTSGHCLGINGTICFGYLGNKWLCNQLG